MDLGSVHYIYIADIDSDASSDACRLTGDPIDDGNIIIYGYVAPYEDTGSEESDSSDDEYRCGVLLTIDEDENSEDDELEVVLTGGDADIDITITIEPQSVSNEYLVLALPRDFVNGDSFTIAFQINDDVSLGEESTFDTDDASKYYSHIFEISADSDVVLQNTLYQPFTSILGRFMSNTGNDQVAAADANFQNVLLPYFSSSRVSNLLLGSGLVGNLATTWISNQGLNMIAVGATMAENVIPDIEIPMTGMTTHGILDWVIEKTQSFVPMIADAVNGIAEDQLANLLPTDGDAGDGDFALPSLPF